VRGAPSILEAFVAFDAEFSILLCRGKDGGTVTWPAPRNLHEGGVLRTSHLPLEGFERQVAEAEALARRVADRLEYVGVLALEFFATGEGPLFNEMAPRVHNSGHWTIEGAVTSQFENHVRAICGLPLGSTDLTGTRIEMSNLIGDEADGWREILADPSAHLHLYGKGEARPGRKMGHVTRVFR
jgi:5-(carboxyamino)imidazole ribonucleotide synthase